MRRPKTYVIDQDEHLQNLRKIIKRDFFATNKEQQDNSIPLRLNDYIKNFKSQQNQIFSQIVQQNSEDWKKKHQWIQKSKKLMIEAEKTSKPFTNMISKDPKMKQIDFSIVNQDPQNAIFFKQNSQTKSFNDPEYDKIKKINYSNCRIEQQELERANIQRKIFTKKRELEEVPSTPILTGNYENNKKFNQILNQNQKYSLKRAPSPEPEKIPIMTWGEVESTPMRLPTSSEYRIPEQSQRDKILQQLTSKLTKQKMIKKNKKQDLKLKYLSSVRPSQSSYRKVSVARQISIKREIKKQETRLDNLLHK